MNIPSTLPVLSYGAHRPGEGKACVMEYVSLLAGEKWSDMPSCTHRALARAAQAVNDRLSDDDRHLLIPLIGRLFGTDAPVDDRVFALRIARTVEHLSPAAKACNDVTDRLLAGGATVEEFREARAAAYAAAAHAANAAYIAVAYNAAAHAADAAAHAADAAASAAYTSYTSYTYDAAYAVAYAGLVDWLSSVIDIYDELSGRTEHRQITDSELAGLALALKEIPA